MKLRSLSESLLLALTVLVLALMAGCTPPDRWSILEPDFEKLVRQDVEDSVDIPDDLKARLPQEPAFELPAAGPLNLSVEQALMLALRNNRDLHVRQLNPVITGTFEQLERGVYDPEIFSELTYREEDDNESSRSTDELTSIGARESTSVAGIRQRLPTGAVVEAAVEQERDTSNDAEEQHTARLGLSLTQSLLRGFGPAVNLVSIRQAELDTIASVYELRGFTEALMVDTEIAYWNLVLARQEIVIFEQSLAIAKQQRDEVEQRIEVGALPEIEAPAARAEVARREQALIDAHSQLEEGRLRLLRLINPDSAGALDHKINTVSDPHIDPEPISDLADRLELAEKLRPDLNEARLRLQQNRLETIVTRNGLLPLLDLFVVLGKTGFSDTFSDSFRELGGKNYDFTAGIRLTHFLGNRAAKARHFAAQASSRQSAEAVENLRQIVRLDVRLAVNELERAREQISASRVTRELEEQTLRAEQEKYNVGFSTALLVAQAQRDLLLSQIVEVRAIVAYRTALVKLHLAEGSLLERRGVRLSNRDVPL